MHRSQSVSLELNTCNFSYQCYLSVVHEGLPDCIQKFSLLLICCSVYFFKAAAVPKRKCMLVHPAKNSTQTQGLCRTGGWGNGRVSCRRTLAWQGSRADGGGGLDSVGWSCTPPHWEVLGPAPPQLWIMSNISDIMQFTLQYHLWWCNAIWVLAASMFLIKNEECILCLMAVLLCANSMKLRCLSGHCRRNLTPELCFYYLNDWRQLVIFDRCVRLRYVKFLQC